MWPFSYWYRTDISSPNYRGEKYRILVLPYRKLTNLLFMARQSISKPFGTTSRIRISDIQMWINFVIFCICAFCHNCSTITFLQTKNLGKTLLNLLWIVCCVRVWAKILFFRFMFTVKKYYLCKLCVIITIGTKVFKRILVWIELITYAKHISLTLSRSKYSSVIISIL
jgi:hypothetical protein